MRLNGNVTPSDKVKAIAGLASGRAMRIAAGTAIYEDDAANVIKIAVPPTESPNPVAKHPAARALINGMTIANMTA